jgi:hypothetical protein
MRSLTHVTPRRKKAPRAAYRPVVAVFEPLIVSDSWRLEWCRVGPNGEMRWAAIHEEGHMILLNPQPPQPSAKDTRASSLSNTRGM